jgi:hypothetical protein
MPLFLLRNGSFRRFKSAPSDLEAYTYMDRYQRRVRVLLDSNSERILLQSQETLSLQGRRKRQGEPGLPRAQAA